MRPALRSCRSPSGTLRRRAPAPRPPREPAPAERRGACSARRLASGIAVATEPRKQRDGSRRPERHVGGRHKVPNVPDTMPARRPSEHHREEVHLQAVRVCDCRPNPSAKNPLRVTRLTPTGSSSRTTLHPFTGRGRAGEKHTYCIRPARRSFPIRSIKISVNCAAPARLTC